MRVGIVTTKDVQKALITEMLAPLVGPLVEYNQSHIDDGELLATNVHLLIVDLSDPAIIESDVVMGMLGREEPVCLMNEKELFSMTQSERIAWRNRTLIEMKKALPDLADDLEERKDEADNKNVPDVWVIGSSAGGPQALRDFFTELPALPVTIFIAQHISEGAFEQLFFRIRDTAKNWTVQMAADGAKVAPNTVFLVPRDKTVEIRGGEVHLANNVVQELSFNPCIDAVIRSLHACHPGKIGVIILSGMGVDGSAAIRAIKGKAKMIMAQDEASCGAKSMPNTARATGAVQLSASPPELAGQLTRLYALVP